jgi:26S proteasome regulatory subunit N6
MSNDQQQEAMDVDSPASTNPPTQDSSLPPPPQDEIDEDEEEDINDLLQLFQSTQDPSTPNYSSDPNTQITSLTSILIEPQNRFGPKSSNLKERSIYQLTRLYCITSNYNAITTILTGSTCAPFFTYATKAKCAKVVRAVLDILTTHAPHALDIQRQTCESILTWCIEQKRTFLRHRVTAKLCSIFYHSQEYGKSQQMVDELLHELKKLDDKQLLVEIHLLESQIHFALRNVPKAKAALTASRTAANAIYVHPGLQASLDTMSGVLHVEEKDYNTAHSYFLEAFEQLDGLSEKGGKGGGGGGKSSVGGSEEEKEYREKALKSLKYMMLCKILDSLVKALSISSKGATGIKTSSSEIDISNMISPKQAVKYAGSDIAAMTAIAKAASTRSLQQYNQVLTTYTSELHNDLLIEHNLSLLREQLLTSNLIRIVEPYSCVEITHVASLMEMEVEVVEKKLSQLILDGKMNGILDQGKGQLILYEEGEKDMAMEKGLEVIKNMDGVVSSLFVRSRALRTMVA